VEARSGREFADECRARSAECWDRLKTQRTGFCKRRVTITKCKYKCAQGICRANFPFDELFQLGIERDNEPVASRTCWDRSRAQGAAPLGRQYFLANWEVDKNVYRQRIFTVKLGPFVDTGAIADSSGLFGSQKWLGIRERNARFGFWGACWSSCRTGVICARPRCVLRNGSALNEAGTHDVSRSPLEVAMGLNAE